MRWVWLIVLALFVVFATPVFPQNTVIKKPSYKIIEKLQRPNYLLIRTEVPRSSNPDSIAIMTRYILENEMPYKGFQNTQSTIMVNYYIGGRGVKNMIATYQSGYIYFAGRFKSYDPVRIK